MGFLRHKGVCIHIHVYINKYMYIYIYVLCVVSTCEGPRIKSWLIYIYICIRHTTSHMNTK